MGKHLDIIEKAVPALNRDCQVLARVIDYGTEHSLFLAHSNLDVYSQEIVNALGEEYNPTQLRLLRDKQELYNLIIELENHRTPVQFLRELKEHRTATVQTPTGKRLPALTAYQSWRATDLEYGIYQLDRVKYRVVPLPWLQLRCIGKWSYEQIIPLKRKNYIGYRKQQPFDVKIGKKIIPGRECVWKGEAFYIWADAIPQGERLVIDGHLCQESEGLAWETELHLGYNEEGEPTIVVGVSKLLAYFPNQGGEYLIITTSQGYEQVEHLRLDGSRQFRRAIAIPLKGFAESVTVSIYLGKQLLDSKIFTPKPAYLFSSQTHQAIRAGSEFERGDRQYYLFASINEHPLTDEGVKFEELNTSFYPYRIYKVNWEDSKQPFSLSAGNLLWSIQQQSYFHVWLETQSTSSIVKLTRNQTHSFKNAPFRVLTNLNLAQTLIKCQVLQSGELIYELEINKCLQPCNSSNLYQFNERFLEQLNDTTANRYGRSDLVFVEDNRLLAQITVALVPKPDILLSHQSRILPEDTTVILNISSPHLDVWNPTTSQISSRATLQLHPKLVAQPWTAEYSAKGIMGLTASAIAAPLVFPAIGETVEISVRPKLFGFRLYQRTYKSGQDGKPHPYYQLVDKLDYYQLETAALYIFTEENCRVTLKAGGREIWSDQADTSGYLLIEGLGFLKQHCQVERTSIAVMCGEIERVFFIHWTPLIHEMTIKENRVHLDLSGPQGTGVLLRFIDLNGAVRAEKRFAGRGERFMVYLDLPLKEISCSPCYLVTMYYFNNGTLLATTWQQRIEPLELVLPTEWLKAGIGISSETLLQTISSIKS
jgi:hypothetical protein